MESNQLVNKFDDKTLDLILKSIVDISQDIQNEEITTENFILLSNLLEYLIQFKVRTIKFVKADNNKNKATEEDDIKDEKIEIFNELIVNVNLIIKNDLKSQIKLINPSLLVDPKNEFVFEVLKLIKEIMQVDKLKQKKLLKNFLNYLALRINFKGESIEIMKLNKKKFEILSNEISSILPKDDFGNILINFIDKANEILNECQIQKVKNLTNEIENEIQNHKSSFDKSIDEIV